MERPVAASQPAAVLIISHDVVGSRMAGPGIRYWELARVLARHFPVTLAVPCRVDLDAPNVEVWPYDMRDWETISPAVKRAGVILLSGDVLGCFPALEEMDIPLVVDGYDPHTLETLALFSGSPDQEFLHHKRERILQIQCRAGDFYVCASERQRDWWLGLLEATGRINVHTYGADPSMRQLVDVVPYGLPSSPLRHTRHVLKGVWPGIAPTDKVVLWGGGLWQWLDPATAIRAMAQVQTKRKDVSMVFPGTRHPNSAAIPEMPVYHTVLRMAAELGLLDKSVFFGDWVPYEDWPNYLAESDVGLSLHLDIVEARLAFRSRILDYAWAGLPMVVTAGDATSELVTQYGLGRTVGYQDVEGVSQSLLEVLDVGPTAFAAGLQEARASLTWERAAEPLIAFCRNPHRAADRAAGYPFRMDPNDSGKSFSDREKEVAGPRAPVRHHDSRPVIWLTKWLRRLRAGAEHP